MIFYQLVLILLRRSRWTKKTNVILCHPKDGPAGDRAGRLQGAPAPSRRSELVYRTVEERTQCVHEMCDFFAPVKVFKLVRTARPACPFSERKSEYDAGGRSQRQLRSHVHANSEMSGATSAFYFTEIMFYGHAQLAFSVGELLTKRHWWDLRVFKYCRRKIQQMSLTVQQLHSENEEHHLHYE